MKNLRLLTPRGLLFSFLLSATVLMPGCKNDDDRIVVSDVKLDKSTLELAIGETYQLKATVIPDNAENKTVTWSSDDTAVASVNEDGLVTALSLGEATITAMAGGKDATCIVTVKDTDEPGDIEVEGVIIVCPQKKINPNQIMKLELELTPEDAVAKNISWTSSNPEIVAVDNDGIVTAIQLGTAEITVTVDGLTDKCEIEVVDIFTTDGDGKTYTFEYLSTLEYSGVIVEGDIYVVSSDIIISESDVLQLRDLEHVKIKDGVSITSNGFLDFNPANTATITRYDESSVPKYIYMTGENSGGEFRNVTFIDVPLRCFGDRAVIVDNCIFKSITSNYAAINLGGAILTTVTNCEFTENGYPAIQGGANIASPLIFKNNTLYRNCNNTRNRPQINIVVAGNGKVEVIDNVIIGPQEITTNGGISVANLAGINGANEVLIKGNEVRDCRYGITTNGVMDVRIIENKLIDNKYESNPNNGGSGISIYNSSGGQKAYIQGNLISGHFWGITSIGSVSNGKGPELNLGNVTPGDNYNPGQNTFVNNGNSGILYDLYNNSPLEIYAQGNKWNVANQDEQSIEQVIFHKNDDESLGLVIFMPASSN